METLDALHVCRMSGEEIAVPRDQLSTVRALKQRLHGLCGVSRFRQRLTHQGTVLVDDARLDAEVTDVELLVLPFSDTSAATPRPKPRNH